MGVGLCLTLSPALGTLPPTGLPRSAVYKGICHSCCIFLGHVWYITLGGLLFSEGKWRRNGSGERGGGRGGTEKSEGRGNCSWDKSKKSF